ncbi:MAG: hypothetical protein ABSD48_09330 [Armatimonadota bacterium]
MEQRPLCEETMKLRHLLLAVLPLPMLLSRADAAECRLYLAEQYDWGAKTGFYLDLEGAKLAGVPLTLAVGDGKEWRLPQCRSGLTFDTPYRVRGVITPVRAQLFVNGELAAESAGGMQPSGATVTFSDQPEWANALGDWIADVSDLQVTVARKGEVVARQGVRSGTQPPAVLRLFEAYTPLTMPLQVQTGDTVTIEASLTFHRADAAAWAPFIDRFGQARQAQWRGKVRSEDELRGDVAAEAARLAQMPPFLDFDQYGGYRKAGWKGQASGFFRVMKRQGMWWLISPEGNPTFYLGVCSVPSSIWTTTPTTGRESLFEWLPPHEGQFARAWGRDAWGAGENTECVSLHACNLIRKYGENWLGRAETQSVARVRAWGFSGEAKWGAPGVLVSTPVLQRGGVPNLVEHPDVFDAAVREAYRAKLAEQIDAERDSSRVLGWSVGSEKDELIQPEEVTDILKMGATVPGKRALVDHILQATYHGSIPALASAWNITAATKDALYGATPTPPAADVETMRRFYADRYYACNYETIKSIDPNHLYLGAYLCPVCPDREEDWRLAAKHADVVSYDLYTPEYGNERLRRLEKELDKPTFCGEFSYPTWYDGQRGFGRFHVNAGSDADAGAKYTAWVKAAAADPYCVGGAWFEYRDEPLTGRGPGFGPDLVYGEHYAFGLIKETDRPKWDQVTRMREANLHAAEWRLKVGRTQ